MFLTAIHTIHVGVKPQEVLPGQVFEINDADGAMLLRVGSAVEPSEDEMRLAGFAKPVEDAPAKPAKAAKAAKAAETEPDV